MSLVPRVGAGMTVNEQTVHTILPQEIDPLYFTDREANLREVGSVAQGCLAARGHCRV